MTSNLKLQFALFSHICQGDVPEVNRDVFVESLAALPLSHEFYNWLDNFEGP